MSLINLVFNLLGNSSTNIGSVDLDALLSESTSLSSTVTQHYVDSGTSINDHISPGSEELSLSGVITGAGVSLFSVGGRSKLIAAKEALREIHAAQLPITIVTGIDVYKDYAMTSCDIKRGDALDQFTVDAKFMKIRYAEAVMAELPEVSASSGGKTGAAAYNNTAKGKAGETAKQVGKQHTKKMNPQLIKCHCRI